MHKNELRNLKRINATPKMCRMAENNHKEMTYRRKWSPNDKKVFQTEYDLMLRCQTRGSLLMVSVFLPEEIERGSIQPVYEVYCNPEGNEYITRILREGKETGWSGAMFENLPHVEERMRKTFPLEGADGRIWQNQGGRDTIQQFLGTKEKGFRGLSEWQRRARDIKTEEKERAEQAPWDADMALVPEMFPSFYAWMQKEAAGQYFMFYHYDKKGTDEGYCSHCGRFVPASAPRHNKKGICSRCGVNVTFKAAGKIKSLRTEPYKGKAVQRIRGGIVIRTFIQWQKYWLCDYRHPKVWTDETARTLIMDDGSVRRYVYGMYKNKRGRFVPDKDMYLFRYTSYYDALMEKMYRKNFPALKKTALKNSTADLWDDMPASVEAYLVMEKKYPVIEKLVRIGMFRLARELMENSGAMDALKNKETELSKILRIDKARFRRLRAADGGRRHLEWYQYEKLNDTIWPDDVIGDMAENGLSPASFRFLPDSVLAGTSPVKMRNYLKKQSAMAGSCMKNMQSTWADYINMAQRAKMDTGNEQVWKPKDLKYAHDALVMFLQMGDAEKEALKLEKRWKKVNGKLPKLQKYEYEDENFSILAPKNILDIVKEGRILQHCVHTCDFYFDRIEKDESYLFFLRRAQHPDMPWYTLEVEPNGNIRQKRTTGDNQNSDFEEAVKFLKKWQEEFVKRMTAEEKKLGKKADQARIAEYAKLRQDGNRVWKGKLAGKLLADVLEADFMAAGI